MERPDEPYRHLYAVLALLPLFFVSGGTALVYQTLWARELHLIFGTSTFAISTVLSAFMAGLAVGGAWVGRIADRTPRPLRLYGLLEIGIGVYSLAFPTLVGFATPIYLSVWQSAQPGPLLFGLIQFALVGSLLLVPTALMGGTLPLLARFTAQRLGSAGGWIGTLYAVNTAGAVFGTWLCGFILLPMFGKADTTWMAAAANLLLGVAAVGLDAWAREDAGKVENDLPAGPLSPVLAPVAAAMALAGFASLVYEVAWTRLMALMLGASVYAFSTMLLAFLVGIALGGQIGGPISDWLARRGQAAVLLALGAIEVGVAVTSFGLMYLYPELPFWYVWLFDWIHAADDPSMMWIVSTAISALIMTPPAVLMGAAFPISVRAVLVREDALAAPVGLVYAANTAGGVVGAFAAGFVFLPNIQVQGTIFVAAMGNLLAALIAVGWAAKMSPNRRAWAMAVPVPMVALAILFGVQRPPWDPLLMTAGMYHYVSHFDVEDHTREGIYDYSVNAYDLVYYREGLSSVVTVAKNRWSKNMWLANNGKVDASTSTDMPTQVLCALLPMQFVEKPEDVLVIGLASGITAGAVTLVDDAKRIDVVELEPAIREAAAFFADNNHHVLDDPRVKLIVNDGRNHVLLAAPQTYDVIISEPPNPWITGVANLFTRDFLEMGKTKLKKGGVWSQWVQMYGMDTKDLRTLIRTFADVYPYIVLYATIEDADLVLVGSDSPIVPTLDAANHLFAWPKARGELTVVKVDEPLDLVALYQMDRDQMLVMAGEGPYNTDDSMTIEYSAPMNLHVDTQTPNFELLLQYHQMPTAYFGDDPERWFALAQNYQGDDDPRAIAALRRAVALVPVEDPRAAEWGALEPVWRAEQLRRAAEDK
jgi:spermidine synthase